MFLERFPWARFETEWNMDKCILSILSSQEPPPPRQQHSFA